MASSDFVIYEVLEAYNDKVSRELKMIDLFLGYVLATGIIQMLYMSVVGSFPFNSFLAGFFSAVGVFVLTVSLRMQLNPENRKNKDNRWSKLTKRRAYLDWLFCNFILHMAVLNFVG